MTALARLSAVEIKLFFRDKTSVFWTFLFPVLMIWLFGQMFGDQKIGEMRYINAYIPSWIAINLLTTAVFTLGTVMAGYRENGVLRRFQATPVRPWIVIAAHIAQGTLIFLVSAAVLLLFGLFVYDLDAPKYLASTILAGVLSMFAIFPFGLFVTSLAKNTRSAAAISSLVLNLMLFLSGATFPLEAMPSFLRMVAKVLPLYYVVDLLRNTWNSSTILDNRLDVAVLLALGIIFTFLAIKFFRWNNE